MLADVIIFAAGLFTWTLVEYVIHGVLSHTYRTFVTPLHDGHHADPHCVFAFRAWIPAAVVLAGAVGFFGLAPGVIFLYGIAAGFAAYEYIHYRIHFVEPSSALEAGLRARHLAHHVTQPDAIFGVTSPLWDVVFGTEPSAERMREYAAAGARVAPLAGRTNVARFIRSYITAH
jgi:sterol desaturase/sphingolipid hydroxylase (fatty acid hydroxylase superfamily)